MFLQPVIVGREMGRSDGGSNMDGADGLAPNPKYDVFLQSTFSGRYCMNETAPVSLPLRNTRL